MDNIVVSLLVLLSLVTRVYGVTKIQTVTIHSPTSGAVLNPVAAAINTKFHSKVYSNLYSYGQYSSYGGIGKGAGLAGYGPSVFHGYEDYGGVFGYPRFGGLHSVTSMHPTAKEAIHSPESAYPLNVFHGSVYHFGMYPGHSDTRGAYPGGYTMAEVYPSIGRLLRQNPSNWNAGVYGSQYGPNQAVYNHGYISYNEVKKLSGYGI